MRVGTLAALCVLASAHIVALVVTLGYAVLTVGLWR